MMERATGLDDDDEDDDEHESALASEPRDHWPGSRLAARPAYGPSHASR
jgi:hypothetical protein